MNGNETLNPILMANCHDKRFFAKMSSDIREMFAKLQDALKSRETQLLRQIEVLSQHCQLTESYDKYTKEISLVFDHSNDIFQSISSLGKIHLNGLHCTSEVFQIEDYQRQEIDHDLFNKYLEKSQHCDSTIKVSHTTTKEKHKQCTKEKCETIKPPNTLLECIGKDDPKLCQHNTKNSDILVNKINTNNDTINTDTDTDTDTDRDTDRDTNTVVNNINSDLIDDKVRKISLQQPVPIQHWMNDIILETELEPTSNNIMEHSQIE